MINVTTGRNEKFILGENAIPSCFAVFNYYQELNKEDTIEQCVMRGIGPKRAEANYDIWINL